MNFKEITVADLNPKHSRGESADNRIRKAWSLQMPDEVRLKFSNFPKDVKLQIYKDLDQQVQKTWTDMLAVSNETARENQVEVRVIEGNRQFKHSIDPDELLIIAAQQVIEQFSKLSAKG